MTKNETEQRPVNRTTFEYSESVQEVACGKFRYQQDEAADAYGLGWLCLTTVMGLLSAGVAVFASILPLSNGMQYFSLSICVATFLLSVIGLVLFFERPMKEDLHHGHR